MSKYIFEENPNPQAKVAFVMWGPFHYYVYKNIIKYLPEAEFIVCNEWYKTSPVQRKEHIESSVALLKHRSCFWRICTEIFDFDAVKKFFSRYDVIVSVLRKPPLASITFEGNDWLSEKKSVLVSYGAGKDLNTFSPSIAHFDLSLVDGIRTHKYHKLLTNSRVIGNPKFDDWFKNSLDQKEIRDIQARLDPKKKTILYLPTHSGLSSIYKFGEVVRTSSEHYNVLVKLHPHNELTENQIVENLKKDRTISVFGEEQDVLPLFFLADAVLSDSSSAVLETLLANRPLVILETMDNEQLLERHAKGKEFNGFWHSGALTYPDSIEQQVKNTDWGLCEVVRKSDKRALRFAIERAVRNHAPRAEKREILNDIFAYRDGTAGKRAAKTIQKLLQNKKQELPLLGVAARHYLNNLERSLIFQSKKLYNRNSQNIPISSSLGIGLVPYRAIKEEKNFIKKMILVVKYLF